MGETPPDFHPGDHCSCHSETQKSAYLWYTCYVGLAQFDLAGQLSVAGICNSTTTGPPA